MVVTQITITITIPNAMNGWVKNQIASGRYGNDSEYFRDLIRRDQDKRFIENELFSLIEDGLNSGGSQEYVPSIMKRVEGRLKKNG